MGYVPEMENNNQIEEPKYLSEIKEFIQSIEYSHKSNMEDIENIDKTINITDDAKRNDIIFNSLQEFNKTHEESTNKYESNNNISTFHEQYMDKEISNCEEYLSQLTNILNN